MAFKQRWLALALTLIVSVGFIDSGRAQTSLEQSLAQEHMLLADHGFIPWQWLKSSCDDCSIMLLPTHEKVRTEKVRLFIQGLSAHKKDLQALYKIHGAEYTMLAQMAVGILGRESLFGESNRYRLKEAMPGGVHLLKVLQSYLTGKPVNENSRGLTQIKFLPELITQNYDINSDNLSVPENAAVATMGYLIEALAQLKRRVVLNKLDHINPQNYADYLPYIYFGGTRAIIKKTATPEKNLYVQDMKVFMSWIEVYEQPLGPQTLDTH
ncbi:MAG: hypothetical protein J7501_01325 [Bdellovibrio sp.]|nr:hypothetical protein [Bdellovibrio sp.]